ncbi:hypothetical protein H4Q26_005302 [Puccinia striiformis f. sp. tritici PST-130]|nr:hypothetical protein H4Q26_005302 [Puccinia striiformis f. sp. tritici PST-130]
MGTGKLARDTEGSKDDEEEGIKHTRKADGRRRLIPLIKKKIISMYAATARPLIQAWKIVLPEVYCRNLGGRVKFNTSCQSV